MALSFSALLNERYALGTYWALQQTQNDCASLGLPGEAATDFNQQNECAEEFSPRKLYSNIRSNRAVVDYRSLSAEDLAGLCAGSSDPEVWEEFVRRFHKLIAVVVLRIARRWEGPSPSVLDDIIQEVYLKLCRDNCRLLREFKLMHPGALAAYLKVVAATTASDHLKSLHAVKRGRNQLSVEVESLESIHSGPQERGLSLADRAILMREIDAFLHKSLIEERDRIIFWLYYRSGMTAQAIASLPSIQLTAKGVESTIYRLTKLVRAELAGDIRNNSRQSKG